MTDYATSEQNRDMSAFCTLSVDFLSHPPENDLYKPIAADDPAVLDLARSVRRLGILEPLVVSADYYVLSGNRRLAAARMAGLDKVPCRMKDVRQGTEEFIRLLVEYNRQREKDPVERAREAVVAINPKDAHRKLVQYRKAASRPEQLEDLEEEIIGTKTRARISDAKRPMLEAALRAIESRRDFWPLSLRTIHYVLLNDPPLRHAGKPSSRYRNDRSSYKDLSNLLQRARLIGKAPWAAVEDTTRPTYEARSYSGAGELLIVEKLTVLPVLEPVADDYRIPLTVCRGYASGPTLKRIVTRFIKSGRDRLALLVASDLDPDGAEIRSSLGRSIRDEYGLSRDQVSVVPVALLPEHVERFKLPPDMDAKTSSTNFRKFVDRFGTSKAYELEALEPRDLQRLAREAIESLLNVEMFHEQQRLEEEDAVIIEVFGDTFSANVLQVLKGFTGGASK